MIHINGFMISLKPINMIARALSRLLCLVGASINSIKLAYYKKLLRVEALNISFPIFISNVKNLNIGENRSFGPFVSIWANEDVSIGKNSMIASHVQITTSTHDYNIRPYRSYRIDKKIVIRSNVWIGSGSIILPGIIIGNNSVIGAGSIVTKDVPVNSLVYGSPARIIKVLTQENLA